MLIHLPRKHFSQLYIWWPPFDPLNLHLKLSLWPSSLTRQTKIASILLLLLQNLFLYIYMITSIYSYMFLGLFIMCFFPWKTMKRHKPQLFEELPYIHNPESGTNTGINDWRIHKLINTTWIKEKKNPTEWKKQQHTDKNPAMFGIIKESCGYSGGHEKGIRRTKNHDGKELCLEITDLRCQAQGWGPFVTERSYLNLWTSTCDMIQVVLTDVERETGYQLQDTITTIPWEKWIIGLNKRRNPAGM